jgi:site-specific recombinase XerD
VVAFATRGGARPEQADRPLSPYTVRGTVQVLKQWARWAVEEEYLSSDPFALESRQRQPQKTIEVFALYHLLALLQACPKHTTLGMRDRAMVLVLLDSGLRASEFVGLKLAHFHLQDSEPWLEVAWQRASTSCESAASLTRPVSALQPRGAAHVLGSHSIGRG